MEHWKWEYPYFCPSSRINFEITTPLVDMELKCPIYYYTDIAKCGLHLWSCGLLNAESQNQTHSVTWWPAMLSGKVLLVGAEHTSCKVMAQKRRTEFMYPWASCFKESRERKMELGYNYLVSQCQFTNQIRFPLPLERSGVGGERG